MSGIPIARIFGFEVRLHASWLFIVAIVTVTVASRLTDFQPGISPELSWAVGLIGSLAFMLTVIVHELAHAIVARRDGLDDDAIVVHFVGAPAAIDVIATTPRAEAAIALAGPLASLAIGAGLVALALSMLAVAGDALAPVADIVVIVAVLNIVLAAISVVPAFPLDGGRLIRAIAWARTGNLRSGTKASGLVGKWVGRGLMVLGFAIILRDDPVDGLMIALAGWFVMTAARSVERYLVLEDLIAGVRVGDAMEARLETLAPQLTLDTFASDLLDGSVGPALPVVRNDEVIGIVGAHQVRRVPRRDWGSTRAEDVMISAPDLPTAGPEEALTVALDRLRNSHLDGLPVLDASGLRGVLTRRSIAELLHARAERRGVPL